ncbi:choice-of-anchor Q domain-containing protein [Candidatus Poribacteria bacterium]
MQRIFSNGGIKRSLWSLFFILAIVLAISASAVAQTTWTVGKTVDGIEQDFTSIQDAVDNSDGGDIIIIVDQDHYEPESIAYINVTKNLTIKGADGLSPAVHERFEITSDPSNNNYIVVSIQDMTICDGVSSDHGGGINNSNSTVELTNCTVSGNTASGSGGIYYDNSDAPLILIDCTVSGNTAADYGGGIYCNEPLELTNCTVSGNAASIGGGIYSASGEKSDTLMLTDCTVSGNTASGDGGGIHNSAPLMLTNCTVSGNSAVSGSGGGIYNSDTLTLTNCTVSDNTASGSGGGIRNNYRATLTNCTVSGNTASGDGGGIHNSDTMTLTNCTVSGNTTSYSGGGIANSEKDVPAVMTLINCTVSGNTAADYGGGISSYGTLTLKNTIVANNTATTDDPDISGIVTANYCLIGDTAGKTIPGDNNITGEDPMLGPLALNDNPNGTWTHELLAGSPAINAGTAIGTAEHPVPTTDQRGFARFNGVDIGAYEYTEPSADAAPPIVSDIQPNPVPVETDITLTAKVDDSETGGSIIISAEYSIDRGLTWSDMDAQDEAFDEVTEVVEASIPAFTEPGVYKVYVRGTDAANNVSVGEYILLAVHDPVGFVSGGGWIMSPAGAYAADPLLTGKANFGFVSKYKKGATVPTGQTEFQFKVASLNFHSDSYEWLVIAGAKAMYKGVGTVNNSGNYEFMLSAIDVDINGSDSHDVDKFRIRIIDDSGTVVYDNQVGNGVDADPTTEIGGGNIKIHAVKAAPPHSRFADTGAALSNGPTRFRLLANYPNPFNPETWVPYELAKDTNVAIRIYSASGRLVRLLDLGHKPAGFYTSREKSAYWDGRNESGESVSSGIYFYQIQAGEFSAIRKMTILK